MSLMGDEGLTQLPWARAKLDELVKCSGSRARARDRKKEHRRTWIRGKVRGRRQG